MSRSKRKVTNKQSRKYRAAQFERPMYDPSQLDKLPVTYQEIINFFTDLGSADPSLLRKETLLRIEQLTGRPLICYVTKTHEVLQGIPAYIDDFDLVGFGDLTYAIEGAAVDVLIISNGGSPEAAERIVQLLRGRFQRIRFLVPHNAYSAATLICFSGDEIIMDSRGTLGPIDPQINGIPARAILRAFEEVEKRLKAEGPQALTAYMPLLSKYDLHILEICKSAQELSQDLARSWLSTYMFRCPPDDKRVTSIVEFFSSYDIHKSHGRSIDREKTRELRLLVTNTETTPGLSELVQSLHNQYELFFDRTPFYKLYENTRGISWGRQAQRMALQVPLMAPSAVPQPPS